jgi:hypothetical protein
MGREPSFCLATGFARMTERKDDKIRVETTDKCMSLFVLDRYCERRAPDVVLLYALIILDIGKRYGEIVTRRGSR